MNREIKFRVWDKRETKGMSTQNMLYNAQSHDLWQDFVDYPGYELMQYTGLNDINGKEIYEGDILINKTTDEEYCSPAVVVWSKYEEIGFSLAYKYKDEIKEHLNILKHSINNINLIQEFRLVRYGTYQVIGNIFENPELLN